MVYKLTLFLKGELGVLRNRLTTVEAKNSNLEQEKEDLKTTIEVIKEMKPENGEY